MHRYNSTVLNKIRHHLKNGGVIAYPTESCFGLGCDPFNYKAINLILKFKSRHKHKGLIVIAKDIDQLNKLIMPFSAGEKEKLKLIWPGAVSLLVNPSQKILPNLIGKHNKIAVRVTKHALVKQICNYCNIPLVSTSANQAGFKSAKNFRQCVNQFRNKDLLILPGLTNFAKKPSTIIDWETQKIFR